MTVIHNRHAVLVIDYVMICAPRCLNSAAETGLRTATCHCRLSGPVGTHSGQLSDELAYLRGQCVSVTTTDNSPRHFYRFHIGD